MASAFRGWRVLSLAFAGFFLYACATPVRVAETCDTDRIEAQDRADVTVPGLSNSCRFYRQMWRGARPDAQAASELLARGVRVVINLQEGHDDLETFAQARPPGEAVVQYYKVPHHQWDVLAPATMDERVARVLAIIKGNPDRPLYLHCAEGQDRTGTMVAAFELLQLQLPAEDAIRRMEAYRGVWKGADAAYIGQLASRREQILRRADEIATTLAPDAEVRCDAQTCRIHSKTEKK